MNWLDIVLLMLVAASVASSVRNGLSREVIGLATVILALLLGIWFYGIPGGYLIPYFSSRHMANFVGFVVVFAAVLVAGSLIGALVGRLLKLTGLSWFDHLLGAAFGAVRGLLMSVALVMAMMAFSPGGHPPPAVVNSRLAPYVVDAARVCAAMAPYELKDGFRKTHAQLKKAWEDAFKKRIRSMPNAEKAQNHEREI
jgi:membrane protein required for colicin V production